VYLALGPATGAGKKLQEGINARKYQPLAKKIGATLGSDFHLFD
jgi:hypothetical protein